MVPPCGSCQGDLYPLTLAGSWSLTFLDRALPDPDDAFMFCAMTESLIETGRKACDRAWDIQTSTNRPWMVSTRSAVSIHSTRR